MLPIAMPHQLPQLVLCMNLLAGALLRPCSRIETEHVPGLLLLFVLQ
jgi:hypothetical protein